MFCANIVLSVLALPLVFVFSESREIYFFSAIIAWLVVGAPLWGWLFERFAAGSSRL